MLVLLGHTRFSRTAQGLDIRELTPDELCESLHLEIGVSREMIELWVSTGGLKSSFEPPKGLKPPPILQKPPSQR